MLNTGRLIEEKQVGAIQLLPILIMLNFFSIVFKKALLKLFKDNVKKKEDDNFEVFLYDFETRDSIQNKLIKKLFDCPCSAKYWLDYVNHAVSALSPSALEKTRLLNKALEMVDEEENKDNKNFVEMQLLFLQCKEDFRSSVEYFEEIIWPKRIGLRFARVFLVWAEMLLKLYGTKPIAIDKAIEVLNRGIECKAEPKHLLSSKLKELEVITRDRLSIGKSVLVNAKCPIETENKIELDELINQTCFQESSHDDRPDIFSNGSQRRKSGRLQTKDVQTNDRIPIIDEVCHSSSNHPSYGISKQKDSESLIEITKGLIDEVKGSSGKSILIPVSSQNKRPFAPTGNI